MLSFFRRIINSRAGVVVTMVVLGVIALAFAAGDVSNLRTQGMAALGAGSGGVAKVGNVTISPAELRTRVQGEFDVARQQQPTLTMAQFVAGGGVDGTLQRMMTGIAFRRFADAQGMVVSKRAVDGALASIPGLQGLNGQFDEATYQRLLAARKMTDGDVRRDLVEQTLSTQLTLPTIGATQVPQAVALPYASLLLEKRDGQVGFVPTKALLSDAAPSDADLAAYYKRNVARYTVPQLRAARYAIVTPDSVKARATPTDAEVAAAYKADAAKYAAAEKRVVATVVAADQATAQAIAAKVRGGASIDDAARAAGLAAATGPARDKAAVAAATSSAIADAVFAAAKGAVVGPIKAPLGFVVAQVKSVEQVQAKSLDQARPEIVEALTKAKTLRVLGQIHDALDDALSRNATFDELVADQKLSPQTTKPLTQAGGDPDAPTAKPDPKLQPILAAAFQAEEGDPPQLVTIGRDGAFALAGLARIVPAAPRPLAAVREAIVHDFKVDRALAAARKVAVAVVAKANGGTPFAQAVAGAGTALPAIKPVSSSRAALASSQGQPPPALVLLFNMKAGATKLLEAPDNSGYYLIHLATITPANAASNPGLVAATRADLGKVQGRELAEEFARAIRASVGTSIDQKALAQVKAELAGQGGGADAN